MTSKHLLDLLLSSVCRSIYGSTMFMRMAQCAPSFFAVSKKLPLLRLFVKVDYCIKYPGSGR